MEQCLKAITDVAGGAEGNLLALAVDAARARCTVGEITQAMEKVLYFTPQLHTKKLIVTTPPEWYFFSSPSFYKVFGRHVAHDTMISGAYKSEYADQKAFDIVAKKVPLLKNLN